jgi:Lysozyme like domain
MTFDQLRALWIARGGDPSMASIMAAIALAESSGNASNTTGDNGTSWGLWQIHWTVHPQFNPAQLTDPAYNTDAAIQLSGNGKDLSPWTTWKSWVAGYGHGYDVISKILGPYPGKDPGSSSSILSGSSNAGSSSSSTSAASTSSTPAGEPAWLKAIHDIPFGIGPATEGVVSAGIVLSASLVLFIIGGAWLIMGNSATRTIATNTIKTGAKTAKAAAIAA